jgi:dienelactone hydrolase
MVLAACALTPAPPVLARVPAGPFEAFRVKTEVEPVAEIAGWLLRAGDGAGKGTLFMLHGYNNSKEYLVGWEWIRDRENWNVLMMDFREHGESTQTPGMSTLGYREVWDVKAVVDYAEAKGLPKPYVIYGRSLGGSTGLRFASDDRRIGGVYAVSPFKNAYLASSQLPATRLHISGLPSPFALHAGYREMLKTVDVPTAVAKRDDLRIWILIGEFDCFPEADQLEILNASPSPAAMKRLVIGKGCNHHDAWSWKGEPGRPGHDDYLLEFLKASLPPVSSPPAAVMAAVKGDGWRAEPMALAGLAAMAGLMGTIVFVKRGRRGA